jgi:hypothetical protein
MRGFTKNLTMDNKRKIVRKSEKKIKEERMAVRWAKD